VLAARRTRPPALAGGWEFPGGKVESGEDGPTALARELAEELGVRARIGARIGRAGDGHVVITLYAATVVDGVPTPIQDHDELRWVGPAELDEPAWLPVDRALIPAVRAALAAGPTDPSGSVDAKR
jgi:8-oxo-dGTP diphosphatase